jgi:hypothetical protein
MADFPDDLNGPLLDWLNAPSVMVNCFRIKRPNIDSDRYIYVPGNSFRLPLEGARDNVDMHPSRFSEKGVDIESETYVPLGPAFMAWPEKTNSLLTSEGPVSLSEFRCVRPGGMPTLGRKVVSASQDPGLPLSPKLPGFSAPISDPRPAIQMASPFYGHMAILKNGQRKYTYDFLPKAHSGWGEGSPVFWAVSPDAVMNTLNQVAQANPRKPANAEELTSAATAQELARLSANVFKPGKSVDAQTLENMRSFFAGKGLPVKAFTTGASADAGFFVSGLIERGLIWSLEKKPIQAYTTFGAGISLAAGATMNLTLGFWWGQSEEEVLKRMEGPGFYMYAGLTIGVGLNIIVCFGWDNLPYGLVLSPQFGPELEAGLGEGVTYTFFYNGPPAGSYTQMSMPSGPWG